MKVLTTTICLAAFLATSPLYSQDSFYRDLEIQRQTNAIEQQTWAIQSAQQAAANQAILDRDTRSREARERSSDARKLRTAITDASDKAVAASHAVTPRRRNSGGKPRFTPEQLAARKAKRVAWNVEMKRDLARRIEIANAKNSRRYYSYESPTYYYYYQQPRRQIYGGYLRGW
jgi:hypothetical protein